MKIVPKLELKRLFIYLWCHKEIVNSTAIVSHGFNLKELEHRLQSCHFQCYPIQYTINYGLVFVRPNGNEAVKLSLRFHLAVIE